MQRHPAEQQPRDDTDGQLGRGRRIYPPAAADVVEEILKEHNPDGVVATLGGQTGLNLCMECEKLGIWKRHKCRVLGTQPDAVERAEAREPFRRTMLEAGQPIIASRGISSVAEAQEFALHTPLPLILRPDFTLGGSGNSVVRDVENFVVQTEDALAASPVGHALIERYLEGWHEMEIEVVRDCAGNALAVCGMENIDPMGVHTGDSVVVSPPLTLTDKEWQMLRTAALKIVDALDIRGACNVQFALAPDGSEYYVIEVNPRASRSSALASKATGYPIARMAAKIALGLELTEMANPVTGAGSALSEPALDYVAVKVPSWPFDSFPQADFTLGPRMKATGEVLAIGTNFAQALTKAWRSVARGKTLPDRKLRSWETRKLWEQVNRPTHLRLDAITELLRRSSTTVDEIARRTHIRRYFIEQLNAIQLAEKYLEEDGAVNGNIASAAMKGFTASQIACAAGLTEEEARNIVKGEGCAAGYREVDGCAGEFPSGSGYYYGAPGAGDDPHGSHEGGVVVLGSGPIRIAQGVEFDYCCVKAVEALRRRGVRAIMMNVNPETVSTDHDISDALYLEPLTVDDAMPILEREKAAGVFACFGGQTSLRLGLDLASRGVKLFGPGAEVIEAAEDRGQFSRLLARIGVPEPKGVDVASVEEALEAADRLGYPLMVRPSFVIGGVAMRAVYDEKALVAVLKEAFDAVPGQKVMVDQFLAGREFECDALCDGGDVLIPGIFEHIDPAGIHSGDSIAVFPSFSLTKEQQDEVLNFVSTISRELNVHGLLNIQFVLRGGAFWIIEANPRASRTVPIASKISGLPLHRHSRRPSARRKTARHALRRRPPSRKRPLGRQGPSLLQRQAPGARPEARAENDVHRRKPRHGEQPFRRDHGRAARHRLDAAAGRTHPHEHSRQRKVRSNAGRGALQAARLDGGGDRGNGGLPQKVGHRGRLRRTRRPRQTAALRRLGPRAQHPRRKRAPHRRRHADTPPRLLGRHPVPALDIRGVGRSRGPRQKINGKQAKFTQRRTRRAPSFLL